LWLDEPEPLIELIFREHLNRTRVERFIDSLVRHQSRNVNSQLVTADHYDIGIFQPSLNWDSPVIAN
jgi:hypothetical protein